MVFFFFLPPSENNMRTPVAPQSVSLFERWTRSQEDRQRQKEV